MILPMPEDPTAGNAVPAATTVRVRVLDPVSDEGSSVREVHSTEFDPTDRGVVLGRVLIPWHRILQYGWLARQTAEPLGRERPVARVRVVVSGPGPEGTSYTLPAERFEAGPWTVALILDDHADAERGVLVVEKLFVPWHRVLEYERLPASDGSVPDPSEAGRSTIPGRPDVGIGVEADRS